MRFVVLKHRRQGCEIHYDLMIEQFENSDKLTTYSLPVGPQELMTAGCTECKKIFDHDRRFLDYEGTVNNGQGNVERIDEGAVAISAERYTFSGIHLKGTFEISGDGACARFVYGKPD